MMHVLLDIPVYFSTSLFLLCCILGREEARDWAGSRLRRRVISSVRMVDWLLSDWGFGVFLTTPFHKAYG